MAETDAQPFIIAHRGASGERPEHTLASYERAIDQGADYIEPDLVLTRDGVLVARHENEISGTTDVADHPEFADRRTSKTIDGQSVSGWFTEDFTLAELRTLRARERLPQLRPANSRFNDLYTIPTFEEILKLVRAKEAETGRRIGLYPETKHPGYFAGLGLPHQAALLDLLSRYGYQTQADPVFIQSFEVGNLKALRAASRLRLIQLVDSQGGPADEPGVAYADMLTVQGLQQVAGYAASVRQRRWCWRRKGRRRWWRGRMMRGLRFMSGRCGWKTAFCRPPSSGPTMRSPVKIRGEGILPPMFRRSPAPASTPCSAIFRNRRAKP
jgi:glycerophosphoryl diester phosphodiesterase